MRPTEHPQHRWFIFRGWKKNMAIPLIPVISALAAGGSLVPHSAGGMIVSMASTGYVAGTYLSSGAIASLVTAASATLGAGVLTVTGFAFTIIGSAGIFGTTIGASGVTGFLMTAGILPATPVWAPIAVGSAAIGGIYLAYLIIRLRRKLELAKAGVEMQFSENEARIIEAIIKWFSKKSPPT